LKKKILDTIWSLSLFWAQKLISTEEGMKIKKNPFSTLIFFLPSLIQLLVIENPKNKNIDSPYSTYVRKIAGAT
jgi:hypothetical protein